MKGISRFFHLKLRFCQRFSTVSLAFLYMDTPVSLQGDAGIHGWKLPFPYAGTVVSRLGTGVPT